MVRVHWDKSKEAGLWLESERKGAEWHKQPTVKPTCRENAKANSSGSVNARTGVLRECLLARAAGGSGARRAEGVG